jgi:hypothetical protein
LTPLFSFFTHLLTSRSSRIAARPAPLCRAAQSNPPAAETESPASTGVVAGAGGRAGVLRHPLHRRQGPGEQPTRRPPSPPARGQEGSRGHRG